MKRVCLFLIVLLAVPSGFGEPPKLSFDLLKSWVYNEERHTPIHRVTIRGVFHCGEIKADGYVLSLYRIEVDEIGPP